MILHIPVIFRFGKNTGIDHIAVLADSKKCLHSHKSGNFATLIARQGNEPLIYFTIFTTDIHCSIFSSNNTKSKAHNEEDGEEQRIPKHRQYHDLCVVINIIPRHTQGIFLAL